MNIKNLVIFILIVFLFKYTVVTCEDFSLEQKIDIFMFYLSCEDQQFNDFLLQNVIEILSTLNNLNTVNQIELYVQILEARFYKN